MADWTEPATWKVGDEVDSETWEDRIYEPVSLLLRRPMLVARITSDFNIGAGSTVDLTYDTIDVDDDGIALDTDWSKFYAQRYGVYMIGATALFYNTNSSSGATVSLNARINGSGTFRHEMKCTAGGATQDHWRSFVAETTLQVGDVIQIRAINNNAAAYQVKAQFNSPRVVIMYKRPAGVG